VQYSALKFWLLEAMVSRASYTPTIKVLYFEVMRYE